MADEQPPPSSSTKRTTLAAAIAVALIAPAEGLRHYVYADPVGIPTYCFGETHNPVAGKFYTTETCRLLLNDHVIDAVKTVDKCVPGLPISVLGAFGSAVYNMGPTIACNVVQSTAAKLLRSGSYLAACNQLPRWNTAHGIALPGLTTRRKAERDACVQGLV